MSYHNLDASELSGEMSIALGEVDKAKAALAPLARTGWPDYKMRAYAAVGRAELAQKNFQAAERMFQAAIDESARGDQAEQLRQIARVGQARCQMESGNLDQAKTMLTEVLKNAPREDRLLHAYAFNALGHYYRKMGQPKAAVQEYLKVDLLFNSDPRQHAEALTNLQQLWTQLKKPTRAEEAAARLRG
jgi:tetratricopeptide (TPR) repeat protein